MFEDIEEDDFSIWEEESETLQADSQVVWLVFLIGCLQRKHYIPDSAISLLLQIIYIFLKVLSKLNPSISDVVKCFPSTLHKMHNLLGLKSTSFTKYVTCPKCSEVYLFSECIEKTGSSKRSKQCRNCQVFLLRQFETPTRKQLFSPYRTYCYYPLKASLQELLNRPNFMNYCHLWHTRKQTEKLSDIYDGKIWQDFQKFNGKDLLADPHTLGLMLNIDWLKPYKHVQYSVGAIYLSIMNLPRQLRFKYENILIIGLIPGPKEQQHDINPFLRPLVSELLRFFDGIEMNVTDEGTMCMIKCVLLCITCDIPAGRKVCGFMGHSAKLGCSKCYKQFSGSFGSKNVSGFNRTNWTPRTEKKHRADVKKIFQCKSKSEQSKLESELGCRYSVLLKLPYFNPIRMCPVNPMHNLYLGTSKHMIKIWIEED